MAQQGLYWLSFADVHKPRGQTFVGVVIVESESCQAALQKVKDTIPMPEAHFDIEVFDLGSAEAMDADFADCLSRTPLNTLLTREQLNEIGHESA